MYSNAGSQFRFSKCKLNFTSRLLSGTPPASMHVGNPSLYDSLRTVTVTASVNLNLKFKFGCLPGHELELQVASPSLTRNVEVAYLLQAAHN